MPITASCPRCGKSYQVREGFAGKKFRCKGCRGIVSVPGVKAAPADPWDEIDIASFQDEDPYADGEQSAPPTRRTRRVKKVRKRRPREGMPGTVMTAVACESILLLLRMLGLVNSLIGLNCCGVGIHLFSVTFSGIAIAGYLQANNVVRWISIVLTGASLIMHAGCGGYFIINEPNAAPGRLPHGVSLVVIIMVVMGVVLPIYVVLLFCLLTPSARDHFER